MGPPRRKVLATAEETMVPPDELAQGHLITRVIKATGNNVYLVETPFKESALVELPSRFRSTIWIKRGSYVVIDTNALEGRDNKLKGEIINIVRDEKAWRKAPFWLVYPHGECFELLLMLWQAQGIHQASCCCFGRRGIRGGV